MGIKKLNKRKRKKLNLAKHLSELRTKVTQQEKEIFDLQQLLEISKSLNSLLEFNRLIESILYVVMAQMKTFGVAIFTKKSFDDDIYLLHSDFYGFEINREKQYSIPDNHELVEFLSKQNKCVTLDELKTGLAKQDDRVLSMLLDLGPSLVVPLKAKSHVVGILLLGEQIEFAVPYSEYDRQIIINIASLAAIAINNSQLLEMTTTDMMTRLKLKHYFYSVLVEKIESIDEFTDLSVLMFDIDDFKKINDTYGHACGDLLLQQVAKIIRDSIRQTDLAARYGGEEFIALLSEADSEIAVTIAERIRKRVENMEIIYDDKPIKVTISIGIAQYIHSRESMKMLVERSDMALYDSKHSGKNRYTISEKNLKAEKKGK
ncbi:MAG: GGDEF domain-containing protein [Treponema sp.]|nr:MAG: GGDEF domain-containing protein [Treponema sp.]